MNLTKFFAAGLCLTAMTASATVLQSDAFENGTYSSNWPGIPGGLFYPGSVVAGDASSAGYTDARPMTGVTSNRVLKLDTEGGVWTNTVVTGSFATTPKFADMLVKFVPSEELPVLTEGKLAIAIKAGAGGTNFLNIANNNTIANTYVWSQTAQAISTSSWYRVTVKMYSDIDAQWTFAQVYVNGLAVGAPLELDGNQTLNSIGFQGTGYIDEVVVRDDSPFIVQFAGTGAVITDPTVYDAWLTANSLTRETVVANQYNAYLMGVAKDTTTSPVLVVNSITVGGTTTLTVMAKYADNSLVSLGTLNNGAVINVLGKVELSDGSWANLGSPLTFNPIVGSSTNHFFKVQIAVP